MTGPSIPVLAIFDLSGEGALVQEFPLTPMEPAGVGFAGAWLRDRFYLYMHYQGVPRLAGVDPATSPFDASSFLELDAGLSGVDRGELPRQFNVDALATGSWLYVYQRLGRWSKGDAREFIEGPVHGGIFVIDPGQGAVINHLAPSQDFWQVVTDEAESALYGLDAGNPEQGLPVRVLAVDANSGVVLRERALDDDVWSLSYATLPATIIPAGSVSAGPCRS